MSKKMVLVPNGDAVYAVPVDVCEQYALEGDALASAKAALEAESSDVEGQSLEYKRYEDGRREAWVRDSSTGSYSRAPWYDVGY